MHDLRSPLMVVRLRAEAAATLISEDHPASDDLARIPLLIDLMVESVERFEHLASLRRTGTPVKVPELLRELEALLSGLLRRRAVSLHVTGSNEPAFLGAGDPVREVALVLAAEIVGKLPRGSKLALRFVHGQPGQTDSLEAAAADSRGEAIPVDVEPETLDLAAEVLRSAGLALLRNEPGLSFRVVTQGAPGEPTG